MELLLAGLAAAAVLLITVGMASRPPKDAVQARLEQLVVQPKTLEEYELQQPFFERVMRPMVKRLSRVGSRGDQGGVIARTDAKLEKAGYPGGLRGADWMGVKILGAIVGAILGFLEIGSGLGGTVGPSFSGLLFDWTGSYTLSFHLSMIMLALAVVCAWLAGRHWHDDPKQ